MTPDQYVALEVQTLLDAIIPAVKAATVFITLAVLLVFFALLLAMAAVRLNGAGAIGVEDTRGGSGIGKLGNLVVLRPDPAACFRNTREIEIVVKRGGVIETVTEIPDQNRSWR